MVRILAYDYSSDKLIQTTVMLTNKKRRTVPLVVRDPLCPTPHSSSSRPQIRKFFLHSTQPIAPFSKNSRGGALDCLDEILRNGRHGRYLPVFNITGS